MPRQRWSKLTDSVGFFFCKGSPAREGPSKERCGEVMLETTTAKARDSDEASTSVLESGEPVVPSPRPQLQLRLREELAT